MEEIKYQAWNKNEECMHSWEQLMSHGYNERWFVDNKDKEYINCVFTDPDLVLRQYTGLKDKNGTEIYEGDLLIPHLYEKSKDERFICEVIFTKGMFCFKINTFICMVSPLYNSLRLAKNAGNEYIVIGNIYEGI